MGARANFRSIGVVIAYAATTVSLGLCALSQHTCKRNDDVKKGNDLEAENSKMKEEMKKLKDWKLVEDACTNEAEAAEKVAENLSAEMAA